MSKIVQSWKTAFDSRSFIVQLSIACITLIVLAFTIDDFFVYIQSVPGRSLNDPVLAAIPPEDMSVVIFGFIYSALIAGLVYLAMSPWQLLMAAEAYLFVTLMRMATLLLFPLEPDGNMVPLNDPFVDNLFYGGVSVTKDLFFSGHVSVLVMLALVADNYFLKRFFIVVALIVGVSMLIQHAHYTIDVAAAPFFAWIATFIALRIAPKSALPK